ncbi:MFS general substrate transporter [Hysterangium stoloniferum]|nr:MFS general substrate transporter [Hysterangium stoloniferum]
MKCLHGASTRRFGAGPDSKMERRLLLKIDWFILSYCCLMANLDRSNISNAYVSGMKEELNMQGTQFNEINIFFTCGYIVGMIPNNLALHRIPPRIWLPSMQLVWGMLTACTSSVTSVEQVYAIRFLQGVAESSTFVGTHYILGSWYKSSELGKRSGVFTSSGLAGTLFSGLLQAAIYKNLNGHAGRSGWRWLFIIDSVITFPIALYGFLMFPDVPATTKAFYLSEEERRLANERVDAETRRRTLSRKAVRRILSRWRWYGCSLLFAISGETESFGSNNLMGQWLKAIGGYSVEQIGKMCIWRIPDFYPSGLTAFGIVSTLIASVLTDSTRSRARWPVLVYFSLCCIVSSICLLIWRSPTGLKFFAWYMSGASYAGQATTFTWANQICADDDFERGIVLASMNMWNNVINVWWSIVFYPATDAPHFTKGMYAMIGACVTTLIVTFGVRWLENRDKRAKAISEKQEDDANSVVEVGSENRKE